MQMSEITHEPKTKSHEGNGNADTARNARYTGVAVLVFIQPAAAHTPNNHNPVSQTA